MKIIHTRIKCNKEIWNSLRAYAIKNDLRINEALEKAITKFLEKQD